MFVKYQHLERLGTSEVEGIQSGTCYVFPKLDGTNASIWMDSEGNLKAGSRNRELTLGKDNAGFYAWVLENETLFRPFFEEYPEHYLYGEWLVPHSLKTYRKDAWRKFYIFDVVDPCGDYIPYNDYKTTLDTYGFDYVPCIAVVKNGDDETFRKSVDRSTFLIEDGNGVGEGVVIKNYDWSNRFGRKTWAKVVTNAFKDLHVKEMGGTTLGGISDEERIVNEFVTEHLVNKVYEKIRNEDGWSSKAIPRLLSTVYYDLIKEEMWEILKKYKNPKIDFKYLQRLTCQKVKEVKPELF